MSHQIKYVKSSKHSNALDESSYLVINGDSAESGHSVMKLATFQERFGIQAVIFQLDLNDSRVMLQPKIMNHIGIAMNGQKVATVIIQGYMRQPQEERISGTQNPRGWTDIGDLWLS